MNFAPDQFGQLENRGRFPCRKIEVLVQRGGMLDTRTQAAGQVAAVSVMAHLTAIAKEMQRILSLQNLLYEIGQNVTHRQLDVAGINLTVAQSAALADADT